VQSGQNRRLGWSTLTIILGVVKCEDRTDWRSCRMGGFDVQNFGFSDLFLTFLIHLSLDFLWSRDIVVNVVARLRN